MVQTDDELVSYWEDFPIPPPPPQEPTINGLLWFGLANGSTEFTDSWYSRKPVPVRLGEDHLKFKETWEKPVDVPATLTRVGLWTTRTKGDLIYWKDTDPVSLLSVGSVTFELAIQDQPMDRPVSFRRMLKGMGLL